MKFFRHLAAVVILVSLVLLIVGKALFSNSPNTFLLVYGVAVIGVVFCTFGISLRYKDPSVELRAKGLNVGMPQPFISCVMAVRNEEKLIHRCITSLIESDYQNKEIIIVNDASTDGTKAALRAFARVKNVKILHLDRNVGKKTAIAEGLKRAKGEIFVFTDSDCVIAPDAISRIVEVFVNDPKVGAVSGHTRALNSDENLLTRVQDSWYETQYSVKKAFESVYGAVCCVSGPLAVFRRSAIYNYIPAWVNDSFLGTEFKFATDRQLTGYVLGSRYIGEKLKKKYAHSDFVKENYPAKEWKVIYCKSAKVLTIVPDTFGKLVKQHIRWKKSFIRNIFFTGTFYWRKHPIPAARFYLGVAFVFLGPFVALRHLIYLPLTGNLLAGVYYLGGILVIGSLYGMMFKIENPDSHLWIYRPLMSLLSTLLLSWLVFYSMFTIRKMVWHR
ncbi:MAG TPA: glycosyltransferase [Candidatus Binatia bacterium]|nr:glycosyltransferase [Candidatus Binatia bacterium]